MSLKQASEQKVDRRLKASPERLATLKEAENLFNNGYRRLWGSGKIKWIYRYQAATTPEQVDLKQLSDNITV